MEIKNGGGIKKGKIKVKLFLQQNQGKLWIFL